MLERIFDLFTQANRALDRSQGGLGIGLTIVRNLVQMHGGTVTAFSRGVGQGSEFVVRLPALDASVPVPAANTEVRKAEPFHPHRILVVEDVIDTAGSLAEILGFWGHTVRIAHDGISALDAAGFFTPDVILLDIGLPGLNGYEVAKRIRNEFNGSIRIISLSGYGQESDRQKALESGIDRFLVKPIDLNELKTILENEP